MDFDIDLPDVNYQHNFTGYIRRKKMSMRSHTRTANDHKIFARTAAGTKKINIAPKVMRGGTRL